MAKRTKKFILVGALSAMATVCVAVGGVQLDKGFAQAMEADIGGEAVYSVTVNGQELGNISIDPMTYSDVAASDGTSIAVDEWVNTAKTGNATKPLIYTAGFSYTTTPERMNVTHTEYTVQYDEAVKAYTVASISTTGSSYIPVGGYVLSVPEGLNWTAEVGDAVTLNGDYKIPDKVIESNKGRRINIDQLNGDRYQPMTVYYDYDFGEKTGTNVFGTEMAAVFDTESGTFKVTQFRPFYGGDASGIVIPDNGFVISCYGVGYRGRLVEGMRFNLGDELTMVGFDYLRFGGTVTYSYDYEYTAESNPESENDANYNPNAWDTATNSWFPAYRGTNQMIVYKDGWDPDKDPATKSGTGTNVYGYEVAVNADGVVVERNVNVSEIPAGGYVLSGHQNARDFIRSSIPMGADIVLDAGRKQISVTTSLNAFYMNTNNTASQIITLAQSRLSQMYDLDKTTIEAKIAELTTALTDLETVKNDVLAKTEANTWTPKEKMSSLMAYNSNKLKVEDLAYEILALSNESKPVTARAVWHRPVEKSYETLIETLDTYQDCGFNLIFVETFFNGFSMFQSEYVEYHKDFANVTYGEYADYLSAFVGEAKKRGIEVHAWVEDFYVGLNINIKLLNDHPDWVMYNNTKDAQGNYTYLQKNEGGEYIFIDPTNKEVTDFLINYYKELLNKNPDIKGLNLDYIRYPVSSRTEDTGYTKNAMLAFASENTRTGVTIKETQNLKTMITNFQKYFSPNYKGGQEAADEFYQKWCDFRVQAITDFVSRVNEEVKADRDILLSTAVFSSINETKSNKKQDWQTWFKNGWIDIATPMAYFDSSADVQEGVTAMIWAAGTKCYYYTGLASSYRGLPAYENNYQIQASYDAGANGYVIFCSTQIIGHDDVQATLKAGVNSKTAILPHDDADKVIKAYFETIVDRAERLYMPANHTNVTKANNLIDKFNAILAMDMTNETGLRAVQTEISDLQKKTSTYVAGYSRARVAATLTELVELLETKIQNGNSYAKAGATPFVIEHLVETETSSDSSVENSGSDSSNQKEKGCKSSLTFVLPTILALAVVSVWTARKYKKEN